MILLIISIIWAVIGLSFCAYTIYANRQIKKYREIYDALEYQDLVNPDYCEKRKYYREKIHKLKDWELGEEDSGYLLVIAFIVALLPLVCVLGVMIDTHLDRNVEKTLATMNYEKAVLEYRLNKVDKEFVEDDSVYAEVVNYNEKIYNIRCRVTNPWIGIFTDKRLLDLEYIVIGKDDQTVANPGSQEELCRK